MKASELRDKSQKNWEQLLSLREEQFKLRMQKATGQLARPICLKENQREIARVKTVTRKGG
jgi:large subunit ribosomal protein L29